MDIVELFEEVKDLERKYIDCSQCPPEESCCTRFGGDLAMTLYPSMVKLLGSEKLLELEDEGTLLPTRFGYRIHGACPFYENEGCSIHEQKIEMGLIACLQFPIHIVRGLYDPVKEDLGSGIVLDLLCPQVREKRVLIRNELDAIVQGRFRIFTRGGPEENYDLRLI